MYVNVPTLYLADSTEAVYLKNLLEKTTFEIYIYVCERERESAELESEIIKKFLHMKSVNVKFLVWTELLHPLFPLFSVIRLRVVQCFVFVSFVFYVRTAQKN